jgi:hypothetical protein
VSDGVANGGSVGNATEFAVRGEVGDDTTPGAIDEGLVAGRGEVKADGATDAEGDEGADGGFAVGLGVIDDGGPDAGFGFGCNESGDEGREALVRFEAVLVSERECVQGIDQTEECPTLTAPPMDAVGATVGVVETVGEETAGFILKDAGVSEEKVGGEIDPGGVATQGAELRQEGTIQVHAIDPDFVFPAVEVGAVDTSAGLSLGHAGQVSGEFECAIPEGWVTFLGEDGQERDTGGDVGERVVT